MRRSPTMSSSGARAAALLLALYASAVLAVDPCANGTDGIGGTGSPREAPAAVNGDGIGGTGSPREAPANGTGDGIGGTGSPREAPAVNGASDGIGGTGIVGAITGFGSICVNGLRVQYDVHTAISVNGEGAPASALHLGQVVAVDATVRGNDVHAKRIEVVHEVVGPI